MSEKYYREINTNKDIVKFKFQLGAILLKLNEHNQNIKDLDTDIKNNDKDIKANYDICTTNNNTLIDIDRKIYAINNNITNLNNDIVNIKEKNKNIIKHNYSIENIWLYNIDKLNTYAITSSKISLFEYYIEGDFVTNSVLEI